LLLIDFVIRVVFLEFTATAANDTASSAAASQGGAASDAVAGASAAEAVSSAGANLLTLTSHITSTFSTFFTFPESPTVSGAPTISETSSKHGLNEAGEAGIGAAVGVAAVLALGFGFLYFNGRMKISMKKDAIEAQAVSQGAPDAQTEDGYHKAELDAIEIQTATNPVDLPGEEVLPHHQEADGSTAIQDNLVSLLEDQH
jgi:hypothetical protein